MIKRGNRIVRKDEPVYLSSDGWVYREDLEQRQREIEHREKQRKIYDERIEREQELYQEGLEKDVYYFSDGVTRSEADDMKVEYGDDKSKEVMVRQYFSDLTKEQVLSRQRHRCAICNQILTTLDFDHIDGNKSNNDFSNCQALCPNCHALKTRRRNSEY